MRIRNETTKPITIEPDEYIDTEIETLRKADGKLVEIMIMRNVTKSGQPMCPECKTNNVSSWEWEGGTALRCHECREVFDL